MKATNKENGPNDDDKGRGEKKTEGKTEAIQRLSSRISGKKKERQYIGNAGEREKKIYNATSSEAMGITVQGETRNEGKSDSREERKKNKSHS